MEEDLDVSETVHDHRILRDWSITNETGGAQHHFPIDMRFNDGHRLSIIVYSVLMVFSGIANITVLVLLVKRRKNNPSRINTMLMHLAIADLLVAFLMMPLEIAWAATVQWKGGDAMCRIMMFFRVFGLFLSSFILVCISVDRFYAVLKPFHMAVIDRREKIMLVGAWMGAVVCSLPQSMVFHLEQHPNVTWYTQCVTFHSFPTQAHEISYSVFGMVMMYALPLLVIVHSYSSILMEIYKRTRSATAVDSITRSSLPFLGKAKIRTLKMTIIIVFVFFICWTPYHVICIWYWYDRESALKIDQRIQKGLFLFACTNSCMNPIVYGVFNIRARRKGHRLPETSTQGSCRLREEVVCRVSWRRNSTQATTTTKQRRVGKEVVCVTCGDAIDAGYGIINGK